jgi:hypothetical protein
MTTAAATRPGFQVDGAFVTDHARERVFEFGWQDALQFLLRALPRLGHDRAIELLAGRARLEGINTLTMRPEPDAAGYLARLDWAFAGSVHDRSHRVWMRPYALVDNWCKEDLRPFRYGAEGSNRYHKQAAMPLGLESFGRVASEWGLYRCILYMDDQQRDRAMVLQLDGTHRTILWREAPAPPIWYEDPDRDRPSAAWQAGLDAYMAAGGGLDRRGGARWRLGAPPDEVEATRARARERPPVPEGMPTGRDAAGPEEPPEPPPTPDRELAADHGWITRDGRFWACRRVEHKHLAYWLLLHLLGREAADPDREATAAGWVKVGSNLDDGSPFLHLEGRATRAQRDTAAGWCARHGHPPGRYDWLAG